MSISITIDVELFRFVCCFWEVFFFFFGVRVLVLKSRSGEQNQKCCLMCADRQMDRGTGFLAREDFSHLSVSASLCRTRSTSRTLRHCGWGWGGRVRKKNTKVLFCCLFVCLFSCRSKGKDFIYSPQNCQLPYRKPHSGDVC